jgi:hypothetical protein
MVLPAADNRDPNSLASRLRRRRTERFARLVKLYPEPVRVLDLGGTSAFWADNAALLNRRCHFTLLNLETTPVESPEDTRHVVGDARHTGFADGEFDVVFSNSVIEHVGTLHDQLSMAREVRRVGDSYFVQTPNRYFLLEPHFLFPAWQFLPLWFRAALHCRVQLGWMQRQPDALLARAGVEQVRLLSRTEMHQLFPGAEIHRETLGPFTKSLIAIRPGGFTTTSGSIVAS